jgi:5-methylcytosine-specific restriction endonuclease McrA
MNQGTSGGGEPKRFRGPGRTPRLRVEVGQRCGKGVVIDPEVRITVRNLRGARLICDCGREYTAAIQRLLSGRTRSCGCRLKKEFVDLTGRRYRKLLVVSRLGSMYPSRAVFWVCRCDCGNETTVTTTELNRGVARSCGCSRGRIWDADAARRSARGRVLKTYKGSARSRGLAWELTDEEFDRLTALECSYCGQPPSRAYKAKTKASCEGGEFIYGGIDRVDNTLGYVTSNVVPCCRTCNIAKNNMSYDEFMAWIVRLMDHHWFHPEKLPSRLLKSVI